MKKHNHPFPSHLEFKEILPIKRDACFKLFMLHYKKLLIRLLTLLLPLKKGEFIQDLDYLNPELISTRQSSDSKKSSKTMIPDLKLQLLMRSAHNEEYQKQIIIEMMTYLHSFIRERILIYLGRYHSDYLNEGEDYENVTSTTAILFSDKPIPGLPQSKELRRVFHMKESTEGSGDSVFWSKKMQIILVEYDKIKGKAIEELNTALEHWSYLIFESETMTKDDFKTLWNKGGTMPEAITAVAQFTDAQLDRRAREARDAFRKNEFDKFHLKKDSEKKGEKKGERKGVKKGIKIGIEQGIEQVARKLLLAQIDHETIIQSTGMNQKSLSKLAETLL